MEELAALFYFLLLNSNTDQDSYGQDQDKDQVGSVPGDCHVAHARWAVAELVKTRAIAVSLTTGACLGPLGGAASPCHCATCREEFHEYIAKN